MTEHVTISGSGKGGAGWFELTDASVYFDHPSHAQAEHTLNIDFLNPARGPSARVAVELHRRVGPRAGRDDPGRPRCRAGSAARTPVGLTAAPRRGFPSVRQT